MNFLHRESRGWSVWQIGVLLIVAVCLILGVIGATALLRRGASPADVATPTLAPPSPTLILPTPRPTATPTPTQTFAPPRRRARPQRQSHKHPNAHADCRHHRHQRFWAARTVQYTMRDIVQIEDEPVTLLERFSRDKLLLIAEGEVVAGFDLAKVTEDDIVVLGTTVLIFLPPPEILYSRIDNENTFVYERETGILRRPDPDLESEARRLAEAHLVNWALDRDILVKAEETGLIYLENFLRLLGFTQIRVEVRQLEGRIGGWVAAGTRRRAAFVSVLRPGGASRYAASLFLPALLFFATFMNSAPAIVIARRAHGDVGRR